MTTLHQRMAFVIRSLCLERVLCLCEENDLHRNRVLPLFGLRSCLP
jgi:hypothetical protein